jgi:eukaryotic-like serine/threonine-protein kinase
MEKSTPATAERDEERLLEVLRVYLADVEGGKQPNRQELIARHPEIADELAACLQGLSFVKSAVGQLAESTGRASKTASELDLSSALPLGDFRLIRQIGRGGMGTVYEAEQLSLNRRVALKVLPMAAALDEKHLQRFKNEAQAAAQLHHTNIVPVYAVGCERSVHFYAMQLIDGQSLADVIGELREGGAQTGDGSSHSGAISSNLTSMRSSKRSEYFRAGARLGLQAAEALDYAHQLGVVHRDIKPANLMIDRRGNLWITDFGLAQFYLDTGLTQTGDLVGTFRYMSPEQASGRGAVLDQRTDVYSLGVTLYELLTLERAIPGENRQELLRQIDAVDPPMLRSIDKAAPIELQTILTKATAKDPAERYPTARALADDLDRFLKDEPILARPPTAWDKGVKWTRRHKSLALAAIVMLLLSVLGLTVSTILIAREQAKTATAYSLEQQKSAEARKSFEQALAAVNYLTDLAANELPKNPQFVQAREHLLEEALGYYQRFIDEHKGDASIDAEVTAARGRANDLLADMSTMDRMIRLMFSIRLLQTPPVHQELNLRQDQAQSIDLLASEYSIDLPPSASATAGRDKLQANITQAETSVASILTNGQLARLEQISRQLRGVAAFSDPDVIQALGLSGDQREAVFKIRSESDFPGGPPNGSGRFRRDEDPAAREKAVDRVLEILTSKQQTAWKELVGERFNGPDIPPDRFGGDRGPGEDRRPDFDQQAPPPPQDQGPPPGP